MEIGRLLRGKIVDQNGHPLERAGIGSAGSKYQLGAETDAAGTFECANALAHSAYHVRYAASTSSADEEFQPNDQVLGRPSDLESARREFESNKSP